ncbi:hypothetical protein CAY57_10255 [Heyndrickxia coagulans]|nr:hypothetical protein CAY57_10255 [Heyndrickxia coagulans]
MVFSNEAGFLKDGPPSKRLYPYQLSPASIHLPPARWQIYEKPINRTCQQMGKIKKASFLHIEPVYVKEASKNEVLP